MATLKRVLERHREVAGVSATVLIDANRYSGKGRKLAREGLDPIWPELQLDAGLAWAVADSGYVIEGDLDGLKALLNDGAEINQRLGGRVLVPIAVDYRFVKERADWLRDTIDDYGVAFGLMLGHAGDPIGTVDAASGVRHVFGGQTVGALLRTDLAAIPAVASGAAFGAIGTNSGMRHIYPPRSGGGPAAGVSAFLPYGMSYHLLDRIAAAAALTPDDVHWRCPCEGCQNGRVDLCVFTSDQAFAHSVRGAVEVARLALRGATSVDNLRSFRARAMSAQLVHLDIEANVDGAWSSPKYLDAWVKALADV
jgi:hypothetical protein